VSVVEVHGTVDEALSHHVERSIAQALKQKPTVIVFDVDTWGGELEAAFEISDAITGIRGCSTASYVRRKAISAGALIGLSAQTVYMAPGATMGDCAPIVQTQEGPKFVGEKVESPLRARFRALARRRGLSPLLAEKMVTKDLEVVEAIDSAGRKSYFTGKDFEALGEGKARYASWKVAVPDGQLLTVDDAEAHELGFSQGTFATFEALSASKGWSASQHLAPTWSERLARGLSSWTPLLFMAGLALLWIEYKTPGGFVFGIAGFALLALALGSKHMMGLSGHVPLLLAALGMLLFLLEVWFLPGTAVFAFLGGVCLLAALTMSLQGFVWPDSHNQLQVATSLKSLGIVAACLLGGFLTSLAVVRYALPHLPLREGMRLEAALPAGSGTAPEEDFTDSEGIAVTDLRPRGTVRVGMREFEGNCLSGYLEAGRKLRVVGRSESGWDVEACT
jgi:membrane-bound serine protease (ClpP class)